MRNPNRILLSFVLLLPTACHKRSRIDAGLDPVPLPGTHEGQRPDAPIAPVTAAEWKEGSPQMLLGNWASSLFYDQRCTAFYTFTAPATAELNLICMNAVKKQFEREFRRYTVAQYAAMPQLRFKPKESSCPPTDQRSIQEEGAAFHFVVDAKAPADQPLKLALWEPDINKAPLKLSKSDGLMADGFPGKTGTWLGMPIVDGCFTGGVVANFQAQTMP